MTDADNNENFSANRISDTEWANRRLCPDGNCIGVIGPDGHCKECGRPVGEDVAPIEDADADLPLFRADDTAIPPIATDSGDIDDEVDRDDWNDRRLCPDGNCIGVIGPDGRCKECGIPAEER